MAQPFAEVARVRGAIEAEVVRGILESYDIEVRLSSRVLHAILPFTVGGLGDVRVLVPEIDLELATDLIARHRQAGFVAVAGGKAAEPEPASAADAELVDEAGAETE